MTERQSPEAICYIEDCAQFRELNAQMHRVPAFAMTLTGGLWFGAGATENLDCAIQFGLLILAGFNNLALILIAYRIRYVMDCYLDRIKDFHPASFVEGIPKNPRPPLLGSRSMIRIFCVFMLLAALLSFIGAFWSYWPFPKSVPRGLGVLGLFVLLLVLGYIVFWRTLLNKEKSEAGSENA